MRKWDAQKKKKARQKKEGFTQASMMGDGEGVAFLEKDQVEVHATYLHEWLMKPDSVLRDFLSATSDGGVFFVAQVHVKTGCAYVRYRQLREDQPTPGVGVKDFVLAAQGRLCE